MKHELLICNFIYELFLIFLQFQTVIVHIYKYLMCVGTWVIALNQYDIKHCFFIQELKQFVLKNVRYI